MSTPSAVALLSGGMDSLVAAAMVRAQGNRLITLAVDYGQRHRAELAAARELSEWLEAEEHVVLGVDLRAIGGSALTDDIDVPHAGGGDEIPVTYVPARNTVLLSLALGLAESRGAVGIVIGVNRIDYSGYPDCRPAFLEAFGKLAEVATKVGVEGHAPRILAPILELSKAEIVARGSALAVPFERSVSCYAATAEGRACARCDACRLRRDGFAAAGVVDPTAYA